MRTDRNTGTQNRAAKGVSYGLFFFLVTIVAFLTLLLSSILAYTTSRSTLLQTIFSSQLQSLKQLNFTADLMSDHAAEIALLLFSDPDLKNALEDSDFSDKEIETIKNKLDYVEGSTSFLHSIYIYNGPSASYFVGAQNYVFYARYSREEFFDKSVHTLVDNVRGYINSAPYAREILMPSYSLSGYSSETHELAQVLSFTFNENLWNPSIIIINIPREWLTSSINQLEPAPGSQTLILDIQGRILARASSPKPDPLFGQIIDDSTLLEKIRSIEDSQRYFIHSVDGKKNLVFFTTIDRMEWTVVQIIPLVKILEPARQLLWHSLLISGIVLVVGLSASLLVSQRLYKPIRIIEKKLEELEQERISSTIVLHEDLIRNLLRRRNYGELFFGRFPVDEEALGIDLHDSIALILLTIDYYEDFCEMVSYDRRNTIKYGILKSFTESFNSGWYQAIADMENEHMSIVYNPGKHGLIPEKRIIAAQRFVENKYRISLTITVGGTARDYSQLNELYTSAVKVAKDRFFLGKGAFISMNSVVHEDDNKFSYPHSGERQAIEAILVGDAISAEVQLSEIISYSARFSFETFHTSMRHFTIAMGARLRQVQHSKNQEIEQYLKKLAVIVDSSPTLADLITDYTHQTDLLCSVFSRNTEDKHRIIIDQTRAYLEEHLIDPNLSLENTAESIGMSPGYLSQVFRNYSGYSIPDYIRTRRLEMAAELVRTTDQNFDEIALSAGIQNTGYFYRIFKKHFGVTPSHYRIQHTGTD